MARVGGINRNLTSGNHQVIFRSSMSSLKDPTKCAVGLRLQAWLAGPQAWLDGPEGETDVQTDGQT